MINLTKKIWILYFIAPVLFVFYFVFFHNVVRINFDKHSDLKEMRVPEGTYKVSIYCSGDLNCETILKLYAHNMDHPLSQIELKGSYNKDLIYKEDWYDNPMIILIEDPNCIQKKLKIKVVFH